MTLDGKACTIVSTNVFGCACPIVLITSVLVAASVTPMPGFVKLTTANPINSAAVVTISK